MTRKDFYKNLRNVLIRISRLKTTAENVKQRNDLVSINSEYVIEFCEDIFNFIEGIIDNEEPKDEVKE